ncbi:MAG: hypothetical protein FWG07_09150 [Treponema sp.]|nr:hypothetical protein [Treponema sp.]
MMSPFRPVSFWESALMTLPDAAFFDLMRSVLGTVKTPFNKQKLVEELSRFIVRPDILENIAAYIDTNDRRIIAAIALLSEPVPGELESFFTGEYSYVELQSMLLNLEERLIIYRFRDKGVLRIALNPRLENILAHYVADKGILFPAIEGESTGNETVESCMFNGRILAALFSFLLNTEVQIKDDGKGTVFTFRKKAIEQGKILFPGLDIDSSTGGLLALGLLCLARDVVVPDEAKITAFKALSDRERLEYLAGGIALFLHRGSISFAGSTGKIGAVPFQRGLLKSTVRLIGNFSDIAKDCKILPEATMIKLAELFRRQETSNWGYPGGNLRPMGSVEYPGGNLRPMGSVEYPEGNLRPIDSVEYPEGNLRPMGSVEYSEGNRSHAAFSDQYRWGIPEELPSASILLRSLVASGLFSLVMIDGKNCYYPSQLLDTEKSAKKPVSGRHGLQNQPCIAMDSGLSCILYPEITFADAMDLAAFSSVEETGITVRFSLSRDSVVRGFDRGYSAEFLWELLEQLSGGRAPDTLKWNLDDWEKRWKEVSLNQGVILTLGGERSYLAETEPIASLIKQNLAPGIYLLSVGIDKAASALSDAGVDIVGRPSITAKSRAANERAAETNIRLIKKVNSEPVIESIVGSRKSTDTFLERSVENSAEQIEQIKKRFRLVLNTLKLTKQEREELESRIERRMIVSETQLKDTSLRYEKLEARSLDYVGKTGVVKQAIVSGSLLELSCLNGDKILGFPESLDKKGGEMILSIKPRDGGEPVKLTLGKISVIRRIKQSIFGV